MATKSCYSFDIDFSKCSSALPSSIERTCLQQVCDNLYCPIAARKIFSQRYSRIEQVKTDLCIAIFRIIRCEETYEKAWQIL